MSAPYRSARGGGNAAPDALDQRKGIIGTPSLRRYRVVVIEWLSHEATLEASSEEEAETMARKLWDQNAECQVFHFEDSGIDGIVVEEISSD